MTPRKTSSRGNILKANLKTPLKNNLKKLKNDQNKALNPEKPELLKFFERMKEKQALNLRNNRANLDTPSVEPLNSTVTSEIPGDQNGTKKHAYREIIYTEKTKNLEILSPNRIKKVSNKIEAKKCETSSRCGDLKITKSLEKIPAKSARLSTISAVRISADN